MANKTAPVNGGLDKVEVTAFVGPAGTGKSQRAQLVALTLGLDYIIDDGLVIRKGQIVLGKSAKAEKNQVKAIRRALFEYEDHRQAVVDFFRTNQPCSLMIIATSPDMASRIVNNLGLNEGYRMISIEDVATPEEISNARRERSLKGQHVIPVSHVQVRKNFAGKLVGRLRVLWTEKGQNDGEKTIVRPPFKFYGNLSIDPRVAEQMAEFIVSRTQQVTSVVSVHARPSNDGLSIFLSLRLSTGDTPFLLLGKTIQTRVASAVGSITGIEVHRVQINVEEVEI